MFLLSFIIKLYIVTLLFRLVATSQELFFNPIGKAVGSVTNPLFKGLKISESHKGKFIPLFIIALILLNALLGTLFTGLSFPSSIFAQIIDYLQFFMLFFMVCVILGNLVNKVMMSAYITYFFRLGLPWIKFTRTFIPVSSGKIIYPAMVVIFIAYMILACGVYFISSFYYASGGAVAGGGLNYYLIMPLKSGLLSVTSLLYYASWAVIIRALLSWVNPDVRNPVVQLIHVLTEPILSFFRRFIPPLGIIDLSAIAAIFLLYVAQAVLQRLINMI